jgi:hypothetical protein
VTDATWQRAAATARRRRRDRIHVSSSEVLAIASATTRSCDRLGVGNVADDRFRLGLERRNGVERLRRDVEMHAFG